MTTSQTTSIALLIDADNAPAAKIEFILSELAAHGVVNIRRAYGNWTKADLAGWTKVLHENSIQAMQSFDLIKGKNATDIALVIDAMDLLYTKKINTFCLVSSDCDFTPLIQRLRADGKEVFGFGEHKTPEPFIVACTKFIYLDDEKPMDSAKASAGSASHPDPTAALQSIQTLKGNAKLIKTFRTAIGAASDDEGWAHIGEVGNRISNEGPFDHRTFGYEKLEDLFEALDLFEVKRVKNGTHTTIFVRVAKVGGKKVKPKASPKAPIDDVDIPF